MMTLKRLFTARGRSVYLTLLILFALLIDDVFFSQGAQDMAAGSMMTLLRRLYFSEIDGLVTWDGKPVQGANITRITKIPTPSGINDKEVTEKTVTDESGRFHFDRLIEYGPSLDAFFRNFFPVHLGIPQEIIIEYQGREYTAWHRQRHYFDFVSEFNSWVPDVPVRIACELKGAPTREEKVLGGKYTSVVPQLSGVRGICDVLNKEDFQDE